MLVEVGKAGVDLSLLMQELGQNLAGPGRWQAAIDRLKAEDKLDGSVKDLAPLIREIQREVLEDEELGRFLIHFFERAIRKGAVEGFAKFYYDSLAEAKKKPVVLDDATGSIEPLSQVMEDELEEVKDLP